MYNLLTGFITTSIRILGDWGFIQELYKTHPLTTLLHMTISLDREFICKIDSSYRILYSCELSFNFLMGATSGAGTAYPSGAPEFTLGF
jgi:hypothetical protein